MRHIRKQLQLLCMLLLGSALGHYAPAAFPDALPVLAQAPAPETPIREQIIDLPEDGTQWWTVICVTPDWRNDPNQRRLVQSFDAEPRLRSLKAQTKFVVYTTRDPWYRQAFASAIAALPAVLVENGKGCVYFKASGAGLAKKPAELGRAIATRIEQCCPRPKPKPQPEPQPKPEPLPVTPPTIPDIDVDTTPPPTTQSPLAALVAALVGAAAGVGNQYRKEA